jgi:hypothetical protein
MFRLFIGGAVGLIGTITILGLVRAIFVFFVKVWQGIANVFNLDRWRYAAKVERVDVDGANEPRQSYLLKSVVNERAYLLCAGGPICAARDCVPVDIN